MCVWTARRKYRLNVSILQNTDLELKGKGLAVEGGEVETGHLAGQRPVLRDQGIVYSIIDV